MNLRDNLLTTTKASETKIQTIVILRQFPQYIISIGLGLLGGATGVALVIGLAIVIQSLLFPTIIFLPGIILLTTAAVLAGLGVSWLLGRVAHRIFPGWSYNLNGKGMQVILTFSTFASLLQVFLFMQGM